MPPELVNILIQLPVVALFVWYFDRVYTRFENFLREERAARDKVLGEILLELRSVRDKLNEHDERVESKLANINPPSKPRPPAR